MVLLTGVMPVTALNGVFLVHFIPYYLLTFWVFEEVGRGFGQTRYIEQYNLARFAAFMWATLGFFKRNLQFKVTWKTRVQTPSAAWYTMPQRLVLIGNAIAICIGIGLAVAGRGLPWGALAANVLRRVNAAWPCCYWRYAWRIAFPAQPLPLSGSFLRPRLLRKSLFCVLDDLSTTGARNGPVGDMARRIITCLTFNRSPSLSAVVRWRSKRPGTVRLRRL
jgi:hypothetical protein